MSGDAGAEFEKQSPEAIVQRVLGVLERIFKPKGIQVPQPVQVLPGFGRAALHGHRQQLLLSRWLAGRAEKRCTPAPADQQDGNVV